MIAPSLVQNRRADRNSDTPRIPSRSPPSSSLTIRGSHPSTNIFSNTADTSHDTLATSSEVPEMITSCYNVASQVLGNTDIAELICGYLTHREISRLTRVSRATLASTRARLLRTIEGRHLSALSISSCDLSEIRVIDGFTFYLHLKLLVTLLPRLTRLRTIRIEDDTATYLGDPALSQISFQPRSEGPRSAVFSDNRSHYRHRGLYLNQPSNELAQFDKIKPILTEYVLNLTPGHRDSMIMDRPQTSMKRRWEPADYPNRREKPGSIVCNPHGRRTEAERGMSNEWLVDVELNAGLDLIDDENKVLKMIAMVGIPSTSDFYHQAAQKLIDRKVTVSHLCLASCGSSVIHRKSTVFSSLSEILADGPLWGVDAEDITVDVSCLDVSECVSVDLHPSIRLVTLIIDGDIPLPAPRVLGKTLASFSRQPAYRLSYTGSRLDNLALSTYNAELKREMGHFS